MSVGKKSEQRSTSAKAWAGRRCGLHRDARSARIRLPLMASRGLRRSVLRDTEAPALLSRLEAENAELCRQVAYLALEVYHLTELTEGRLSRRN
jgi:hypothetical protein